VSERLKFVAAALRGKKTMTELCEEFGVSRSTGDELLARYALEEPNRLDDRSRAPRAHPNQTIAGVEADILRVRKSRPTWGSKKILAVLDRDRTSEEWPARSTVDLILKRAGVVSPRGRRNRRQPSAPPFVVALEPLDVWSIDDKGWYIVDDVTRCDPLMVVVFMKLLPV